MALQLRLSVCENGTCDGLSFSETTGAYDAVSNPNGWNAPNTLLSTATAATLTITLANGTILPTIDLFATSLFPNINPLQLYTITNAILGYSGTIPDQIITFLYTVIANGITYTQTIQKAFFCNVKCCVYSMTKNIDVDCSCSKDTIDSFLKGFTLLKGLEASAGCGNIINFNNILNQLNKLCAGNSCANCK